MWILLPLHLFLGVSLAQSPSDDVLVAFAAGSNAPELVDLSNGVCPMSLVPPLLPFSSSSVSSAVYSSGLGLVACSDVGGCYYLNQSHRQEEEFSWNPLPHIARSHYDAVVLDVPMDLGLLWVIGEDSSHTLLLTSASDDWVRGPELPAALVQICAKSFNIGEGKSVLMGRDAADGVLRVVIFDWASEEWLEVSTNPMIDIIDARLERTSCTQFGDGVLMAFFEGSHTESRWQSTKYLVQCQLDITSLAWDCRDIRFDDVAEDFHAYPSVSLARGSSPVLAVEKRDANCHRATRFYEYDGSRWLQAEGYLVSPAGPATYVLAAVPREVIGATESACRGHFDPRAPNECLDGWTGDFCDERESGGDQPSACSPNPCWNGAECVSRSSSEFDFTCECRFSETSDKNRLCIDDEYLSEDSTKGLFIWSRSESSLKGVLNLSGKVCNGLEATKFPIEGWKPAVGAAAYGSQLFCGGQKDEERATQTCRRFDEHSQTWQWVGELLRPRSGRAESYSLPNGTLWLLGGDVSNKCSLIGGETSTTELFVGGSWFEGPAMPTANTVSCLANLNDTHTFVGTRYSTSRAAGSAFWILDWTTQTWSKIKTPFRRQYRRDLLESVCIGLNETFVLVMGQGNDEAYQVDLQTRLWHPFPSPKLTVAQEKLWLGKSTLHDNKVLLLVSDRGIGSLSLYRLSVNEWARVGDEVLLDVPRRNDVIIVQAASTC